MTNLVFNELTRKQFVELKQQFVHPAKEVSQPSQLIGREDSLRLARSALERDGSNIFVWGQRGVGKTSLAHSAVAKFDDIIQFGAAIACQKDSTVNVLFQDLIRRSLASQNSLQKNSMLKIKFEALGLSVEGQLGGFKAPVEIRSVNHASEILDALYPINQQNRKKTAVIIDEFDQLENKETIYFLTALAKQMSVDEVDVKIIYCGVARDLESLIGSHESIGRYISAIKLSPLKADDIWNIVTTIVGQFGVLITRGQTIRIGQIACGYPTFAHLVIDEVLNVAFEQSFSGEEISQDIFNEAMRRAASGAATHLQRSYETATMRSSDRYIEVLWAAAHGPHIQERQFKSILSDYRAIMRNRPGREEIDSEQNVRNHVNALCADSNGSVLEKLNTGWYRFRDPMFRGYVRMMAYNDGIELGDESFQN